MGLEPTAADLALARRALLDTMAVALAGRCAVPGPVLQPLSEAGRWAVWAHVLDFDDLHLPSTAHISAVCVPVALASGGGARAYLAGAGVMARLGAVLGWRHYSSGWHATCTAGAPAAAAAAAVARGLEREAVARAMALAVPGAGGVQRAFGSLAKSLQVAFAVETGLRAAALAAAGADADPSALDDWVRLVGGDPAALPVSEEAIPGGLAVKPYPCCYALQRPIAAVAALGPVNLEALSRIEVATPASALAPLIHHRPTSGLEAKFSLEYGVAAALTDEPVGLDTFSDEAVRRPQVRRVMELVNVSDGGGGEGLLAGAVKISLALDDGAALHSELALPPGAPGRPLSDAELERKLESCAGPLAEDLSRLDWAEAGEFLRAGLAAS